MDDDTVRELRSTLREVFASSDSTSSTSKALDDLGWSEVYTEDPASASILLLEEQGRSLGLSRFLNTLLVEVVAPDLALDRPAIIALPGPGGAAVLRGPLEGVELIVVPVGRESAVVLEIDTVELRRVSGIDPSGELHEVEATDVLAGATKTVTSWTYALALARRCLAAELVGCGRGALALGIEHVTTRTQFGRPIGSFQAVRHRLAETYAELESASTLVEAAFASEGVEDAMIAKAAAGRAVDRGVRSVIQVSGAMGLTWEFPLHNFVRRSAVLDALAGDAEELEIELGSRVVGLLS